MRNSKGVEVKEPGSVDAAPLSSGDEDEDEAYRRDSEHEDSDNERQRAANIVPSFGKASKAQLSTGGNAKQGTQGSANPPRGQADKGKDPISEGSQQSVGSKRPAHEMGQDPKDHFTDAFGFSKKLKNKSSVSSLKYGKSAGKSERAAGTRRPSSQGMCCLST
jgi:hypothetical protein